MFAVAPVGTLAFAGLYLHDRAQPAYLFVAIAFPFALYVQSIGIVYLLRDRVERINVKNSLTIGGAGSLATLVLAVAHASLAVVMSVWVLTYVVAACWNTAGLRTMLGGAPDLRAGTVARDMIGFATKAALSANVTFLALRIDVFIVGALLSPATLGIYTLALGLGEVMWGLSRALLWSATGRIATLDPAGSAALTARCVRTIVALQCVAAASLFAVAPWVVPTVFGPRFAQAAGVLRLLLPGMVLYGADGLLSYFIAVRAARPGLLLALECVTLAVCASVTFATIATLGLYAGALANTIAYVLSYAVKSAVFVRLSGTPARDLLVPRPGDFGAAFGRATRPSTSLP